MNLPQINLIGVPITALPLMEQIQVIIDWAKQRSSRVICVANVHMLMEARWDNRFHKVLGGADLVTPDGMPLVWLMKALGIKSQDRVAGLDIFLNVCQIASKEEIKIYLLGCTQDILERIKLRLHREFPNVILAGLEPLPFRPLTDSEDAELVKRINASQASIVFLALGCPKQEYWMAHHQGKIKAVMIGIGGVFPVYAGLKKNAPEWVKVGGLEWLYRLVQEPKRLWNRYRKTIPPFIFLALQQLVLEYKHGVFSLNQKKKAL